jgi:HSP20 family protein
MDRLMSDFFGPINRDWQGRWSPAVGTPRINVWEEKENVLAEAEVPGLKAEDLDISVVRDQLTIKGKREDVKTEKDTAFHRRERTVGEFVRTLTLPVDVDADKVAATLVNGVLTVKMPKAVHALPRKVTVS